MTLQELPFRESELDPKSPDTAIIKEANDMRRGATDLFEQEKYTDALRTVVEALRKLREASDYSHREFKAVLVGLLFDLSEIHFALKDYKQSEKDLDMLFKVIEPLLKEDADRFGHLHVLAMELSTRILRSRRKTLELLAKQQINNGILYDKVNAGVAAATDKLVESLRRSAEMLASAGDYHAAVKFYAEAIKLAKKRAGKVTRREVQMTVEMAAVMMRSKSETPRAQRLLNAILPHAISLETVELEQEILSMLQSIENNVAHDSKWRNFLDKVQQATRKRFGKKQNDGEQPEENSEDNAGEKDEQAGDAGSDSDQN